MKIILIEDEMALASSVENYLKKEGYVCESANDYITAIEKIHFYEYDIALVDITLPDGNGLEIIKLLKELNPKTGILIISAKNSLDDKISGLDLGADDYITKPFHLAELNSRVKAVIRRRNYDGEKIISINEIEINFEKHSVSVNNEVLELTKKEYDLLMYLVANKGRVITKESIAEHLWGDNIDSADSFEFIYTHIKNLRKKITGKGGKEYIVSVYGVGYKFLTE